MGIPNINFSGKMTYYGDGCGCIFVGAGFKPAPTIHRRYSVYFVQKQQPTIADCCVVLCILWCEKAATRLPCAAG